MVDLLLGANVTPGTDAEFAYYIAGATIAAGQTVYVDKSDAGKVKLATTGSVAASKAIGVAVSGGVAGQPITVMIRGTLENCATMVVGSSYFVADTAGALYPPADITVGDFGCLAGFALTATKLKLVMASSGIARA